MKTNTTQSNATLPKFPLGQVVQTQGVAHEIHPITVAACLGRHIRGDWGNVSPEDAKENNLSLKNGFRLLSSYKDLNGTKFWIITEADRSVTTVLLPSEY